MKSLTRGEITHSGLFSVTMTDNTGSKVILSSLSLDDLKEKVRIYFLVWLNG